MSSGAFSFQQWYQANGERLNEKRKARYHADPEYREKVLKQNQESRAKRKEEARKQPRPPRPPQPSRLERPIEMEVEGVVQRVFTTGAVAKQLGCSVQTLRQWEAKGVIPETPLRAEHGSSRDRLYTAQMVDEMRTQLHAQGRLQRRKPLVRPDGLKRYVRFKDRHVEEVQLYLIGVLAKTVNRNVVTLKQMEARGLLPRTPFVTSRVDRRLYTKPMIDAVKTAFERYAYDLRDPEYGKLFHDQILAQWTAQGIVGAVLVQSAPKKGTDSGRH